MAAVRTILFLLVFYGGSTLHVIIAFAGSIFSVRMMRWVVRCWSRYQTFCARWILGVHVKIDGYIPDKPVLFAIKHESMFETIDMHRFFDYPAVVAKVQLSRIPFWGFAARRYGMIFVDRDGGAQTLRQMLAQAKQAIVDERPIVIFPEGTRVERGNRPPLQSGFAGLYKMLKLPVVPIAVDSGKCIPRSSWIYRPGVIQYRIGEEIPAGLPRDEIERRVHSAINVLNQTAST
ncbi:lysophospholipid acyltransferase family protein [Sphingorhabdus arenilitoris]|uniref:Lysophospholipid acyltransferase family protein n=1 Tax=Sphingorhabdus arenilitoris TaxID=1490041 RepID=A0ABV8RLF6_9SPHN